MIPLYPSLFLLSTLFILYQPAFTKHVEHPFTIHPGNPTEISISLDTPPITASTCTLSTQTLGGSPEEWLIQMDGTQTTGEIICKIMRKGNEHTYLLFNSFKVTLGEAPLLEAVVHGNEGKLEEGDHFETDGECVKNRKEWSGQIRSVVVKSKIMS